MHPYQILQLTLATHAMKLKVEIIITIVPFTCFLLLLLLHTHENTDGIKFVIIFIQWMTVYSQAVGNKDRHGHGNCICESVEGEHDM